jgi:hypothetical protein
VNAIIERIIKHILNHYRAEIIEIAKEHIRDALNDFEARAEKTDNPIDDFVIDLAQNILNLE